MTVCATPACRRDTARPGSSDRFALCSDCTDTLLAGRELASTPAGLGGGASPRVSTGTRSGRPTVPAVAGSS